MGHLPWQSVGIEDQVKFLRQVIVGDTSGIIVYPFLQK